MEKIKIIGTVKYRTSNKGLEIIEKKETGGEIFAHNLISGKSFYNSVESCCVLPKDGYMAGIILNGYNTNLILDNFEGYGVQTSIDLETLGDLCKENDVIVNWVKV